MSEFVRGIIADVVVAEILRHVDERGWLAELYREDTVGSQYRPVMSYFSMTQPDVVRGPHEHAEQADCFAFIGPSDFKIYLWDARTKSPSYMTLQIIVAGENSPKSVIIPPGVVHAYKNIGGKLGAVLNFPNRLFGGRGKTEPIDEIRHESDPNSPFVLD